MEELEDEDEVVEVVEVDPVFAVDPAESGKIGFIVRGEPDVVKFVVVIDTVVDCPGELTCVLMLTEDSLQIPLTLAYPSKQTKHVRESV